MAGKLPAMLSLCSPKPEAVKGHLPIQMYITSHLSDYPLREETLWIRFLYLFAVS